MKNIIDELYNGNIEPYAKTFIRSSNYGKASNESFEHYEKLMEMLDEDGKKMLDQMLDLQGDMQAIATQESFVEGFKVGMQIAVAALCEDRKVEFKNVAE